MRQVTLCECGCGEPAPLGYRGRQLRFINHHNFRGSNKGEANPAWKGDEAGYNAMHVWLGRHKERTGVCEECGREGYTHFANISGELRRDVSDYRELCPPCHRQSDLPSITEKYRASLEAGHAL